MKIVAKTIKGQEFFYNPITAHKVPDSSANKICDALNAARYDLLEKQVWFVYTVDMYDTAYSFGEMQKFSIYKGKVRETR